MKESIMQVRMDSSTKEKVEKIYKDLGTSFAEAIRIFAIQSINENGFPFQASVNKSNNTSLRGVLSSYANKELREKEEKAFMEAMKDKYE